MQMKMNDAATKRYSRQILCPSSAVPLPGVAAKKVFFLLEKKRKYRQKMSTSFTQKRKYRMIFCSLDLNTNVEKKRQSILTTFTFTGYPIL